MRKYEEEHYKFDNIKDMIYPWVTKELIDKRALNGKTVSEKDTPLVSFVGDLLIMFAIKRGEETFEILKDNMLPPEVSVETVYQIACQNLVRDVEFTIANTMYGAFAIMADGFHESSAILFQHIWSVCAEKLEDDIVIAVPTTDTLLFAAVNNDKAVDTMKVHMEQAFDQRPDKVTKSLFLFLKDQKELVTYGEMEH